MIKGEAAGDMVAIRGKLAAKYDHEIEAAVITWFKQLLNVDLRPGMRELEDQLRSGQLLVSTLVELRAIFNVAEMTSERFWRRLLRLAKTIQRQTPNCPEKARKMVLKVNPPQTAFKQMENIQTFLKFCESYGVSKTGLFQTVDLYEGRNMAQVLYCLQQLGSECQRNEFDGPSIGPKPAEKNVREFSDEQMKAGETVIGLQAGTNKCASQSGSRCFGGVRHVADIRADDLNRAATAIISLQAGSNRGASQSGMSVIGGVRHVADIRADNVSRTGAAIIGLQMGTNQGANQSGMTMGGVRHVADIRADGLTKEGAAIISLQAGTNKGASQAGMSAMGGVRHVADIRADELAKEGAGYIGLQAGTNKFATQTGMSMGGIRHVADIRADGVTKEGSSVIGLQMGSNKGASQKGMSSMGGLRHVADIRADNMNQQSQGVINLQYGTAAGATQAGMTMGTRRDITRVQ